MTTNYYVRHLDHSSSEQLCLNVYNFLNNSEEMPETVYVVEHVMLKQQYKDILNKLINTTYINPDKFLNIYSNCSAPVEITFTTNIVTLSPALGDQNNSIAVVLYVYYPELLREFIEYINIFSNNYKIDVYLYICENIPDKNIQDIISSYSNNINYNYEHTPNRGRDILSFLSFIQTKKYEKYKYICKLHTKKTNYLDPEWRTNLLKYLLNVNVFNNTIKPQLNSRQPKIQSCSKYNLIENYNQRNNNYSSMYNLCKTIKHNLYTHNRYEFIAGSMFWVNQSYASSLHKLIENVDIHNMFELEPIPPDGTIAHAWERLFYNL